MTYRGRFAPSPTGAVHLGTARTALVAWLRARQANGVFVLRVEDLDSPRTKSGSLESILDDLRWLGLDWDEGPGARESSGPYKQSERLELYAQAIAMLEAKHLLFPCTCSRKEISEIASAPHGEEPIYPGTCRLGASHPERPASLRFRLETPPSFDDICFGPSRPELGAGDFVVRRSDGVFAYQLAVVVDDIAMKITEVVRGRDLLSSTPKQIALYHALNGDVPAFFHVPLVLGPDKERLAKRHGAVTLAEHRSRGVSPGRMRAALSASLDLVPDLSGSDEVSMAELVRHARLERISREDSVLEEIR